LGVRIRNGRIKLISQCGNSAFVFLTAHVEKEVNCGRKTNAFRVLIGKPERKSSRSRIGLDLGITTKCVLRKENGWLYTVWMWLRGGIMVDTVLLRPSLYDLYIFS
jgi:hypothetical protein